MKTQMFASVLIAAFAWLTGCQESAVRENPPEQVANGNEIDKPTTAVVKGVVTFEGKRPEIKKIVALPAFKAHVDKNICAKGDINEPKWMIDKEGRVENVLIVLSPAEGKSFKITDKLKQDFVTRRGDLVIMDQPFCQFIPHVAAMYVGIQDFQAKNSAVIKHSVKITASARNGGSTAESVEAGASTRRKRYSRAQSEPIRIECADHSWMYALLWTFDHPYFAVTKADGSFEIANVPIDEELIVYTWHEVPGKKEAAKQKFKEGENKLDLSVSK